MGSSCPLFSVPGNSCPTSCAGGDCPPCSTCPNVVSSTVTFITPKGCPTGYTHRFVSPGDATKDAPEPSYYTYTNKASSKFVIEHYCCKEIPSP